MILVRKDDHSVRIVATIERLLGTCHIDIGSTEDNGDGTFAIEYAGGTDIHWDSSETLMLDGERVFEDANGAQVFESDCELIEEGEHDVD